MRRKKETASTLPPFPHSPEKKEKGGHANSLPWKKVHPLSFGHGAFPNSKKKKGGWGIRRLAGQRRGSGPDGKKKKGSPGQEISFQKGKKYLSRH